MAGKKSPTAKRVEPVTLTDGDLGVTSSVAVNGDPVQGVNETFDGDPIESEQLDAPELTRGGKLKQAWTDDATGKTYMPGEKLEDADVE